MDINLIIVIVLLVFAIFDLMVGVANDAVNFLNSAIGSKAAPFKWLIIIAAAGLLAGVLMSSGMMEIARKGIFNPQYFLMPELMIIFVAVMFQDIILLDLYNTLGLPTSTTVSIVFGLFGSALAVSLIKINATTGDYSELVNYIEFGKVGTILGAIVSSIIIAFVVGVIIQYISRLIFTFSFKERVRKYGALWGGIALTSLSFFIILKGAKGATFLGPDFSKQVIANIIPIATGLLVAWTAVLLILMHMFKVNILKFIVLFGTFSLALAFASNDLVNFIGAPLAGFNAYTLAQETADPLNTPMGMLSGKVQAQTWILLLAGAIMAVTLFFNKKAYTVAKTTIALGRQGDGYERFKSNAFSRVLVRGVINIGNTFKAVMGPGYHSWAGTRMNVEGYLADEENSDDKAAFDLVRAAVILMVSAMLISYATYLKLPLSTTYVTFIVAMAAALPDKAWGRESAVYRVSGVVTVVLGWFGTALSASLIAGVIATIIYFGGVYAIFGLIALTIFIVYKTSRLHKNIENTHNEKELSLKLTKSQETHALDKSFKSITMMINDLNTQLTKSINGLINDNVKHTKTARNVIKDHSFSNYTISIDLLKVLDHDDTDELEVADLFAFAISGVKNINTSSREIAESIYDYVSNNHDPLTEDQQSELIDLDTKLSNYIDKATNVFRKRDFEDIESITELYQEIDQMIAKLNKKQMKRVKKNKSKIRRSILYLNILKEIKTLTTSYLDTANSFAELYKKDEFIVNKNN